MANALETYAGPLSLITHRHLDAGQPSGVIDGDMDLVEANTSGSALLPIAGDAVTHLPEPRQRLDDDVDQVSRPLPFVPLDRWFGVQIPETAQAQPADGSGDGRERGMELTCPPSLPLDQ